MCCSSVLPELLEAPSGPDELEAVTKAKTLYRSCMNESESDTHTHTRPASGRDLFSNCVLPRASTAALEEADSQPMLGTLRQPAFRWPVVGDGLGGDYRWLAADWSLLKTLTAMRNQHAKSVLVRLYVSPDDKKSFQYIIKVRRPRRQQSRVSLFGKICFIHEF